MQSVSYLPQVKEQYEHYPYPPRDPQDERKVLHPSITECLDALNHHGYGGRRNFHKNFRALVAGGGTGDAVIFLAEQLRGTEAEIVYLDMSQASMDIAKARSSVRGLDNIRWVQASLLDLASLGLGRFDYINCAGVLHHLKNPEAGLQALCDALALNGVMGLMLYGKYGRTAIYQMQALLQLLAEGESAAAKLDLCKKVLSTLPPTNWFMHSQHWFGDLRSGDAALYDLLLHSQDRAYSIPELYAFMRQAGLVIVTFLGHNACDPRPYLKDDALLERVEKLDAQTQYAIGELLAGTVKGHTFYAARAIVPPPEPNDLEMIPSLPVNFGNSYEDFYHMVKQSPKGIFLKTQERTVVMSGHPMLEYVLKYMDGKRTLKEIFAKATAFDNAKRPELQQAFDLLYRALCPTQMLFLRHKGVPHYLTTREMQSRLED